MEDCGNSRSETRWSTNTEEGTGREHSANREKLRKEPHLWKRMAAGSGLILVGFLTACLIGAP